MPKTSAAAEKVAAQPPPKTRQAKPEPAPDPEPVDVRVVVVPYGNIWIDGRRRGSTRVRARLQPGRHRIGIGRGDAPTRHEEVVLAPGDGTRTLEYQLRGAFE